MQNLSCSGPANDKQSPLTSTHFGVPVPCLLKLGALFSMSFAVMTGRTTDSFQTVSSPGLVESQARTFQTGADQRDVPGVGVSSKRPAMSKITNLLIESDQCRATGNITQAITFAEKAVAEIDSTTPRRLSAIAYTKLSQLREDRGQLSEAESLSRGALNLLDDGVRDQSTDYAIVCGNLADVLAKEWHYIEATPILDEAIQIYQRNGKTRTKQYADLLAIKGELLFEQDRIREAIRALTEELHIRQDTNAPPDQLGRLCQDFAVTLEKAGKLNEALEFLKKDQRIWSDTLPDDHPDKVSSTATLLVLLTKSRHYAEADSLVPFLLVHGERAFGSDNPAFAVILSNVGMLYERQKQHQQAAVFLRRALQIDQRALGPFHPATANVLKWYGITLTRLGRTEEGRSVESQAKAALSLVH